MEDWKERKKTKDEMLMEIVKQMIEHAPQEIVYIVCPHHAWRGNYSIHAWDVALNDKMITIKNKLITEQDCAKIKEYQQQYQELVNMKKNLEKYKKYCLGVE